MVFADFLSSPVMTPRFCENTKEFESGPLKDVRKFGEEGVPLIRVLTKLCCTPLVGELNRPKRRFVAPHEDNL